MGVCGGGTVLTGVVRVGAGMSSAFWLTPPHDSAPNALLAHEVGSHKVVMRGYQEGLNAESSRQIVLVHLVYLIWSTNYHPARGMFRDFG